MCRLILSMALIIIKQAVIMQKLYHRHSPSSIQSFIIHMYNTPVYSCILQGWDIERSEVTHAQQLPQFILNQLFQLSFTQGVFVSLFARVFIEGGDEESHSILDVRHDDCWWKWTERKNRVKYGQTEFPLCHQNCTL